jgi:AGZA family xanthine/uracil permease-like MFS transporter
MKKFLNRYFKIEERGSTIYREILAGIISFLAMVYIVPTTAGILGKMGMDNGGVFVASALIAASTSIMMGLIGNAPLVLGTGLGVSGFLSVTVYNATQDWKQALIVLFIVGIILCVIGVTPIRKKLLNALPKEVKLMISAGLGGFILFASLKNGGVIAANDGGLGLGNLAAPEVLLALFGMIIVLIFMFAPNKKLNQVAIPVALLVTAVTGVIVNYVFFDGVGAGLPYFQNTNWGGAGLENVAFKIFEGEDWQAVLSNPSIYGVIFSLLLVQFFEVNTAIIPLTTQAGLIDKEGNPLNERRLFIADAVNGVIAAPLGTSSTTTFIESSAGIGAGAKTGLMAVTAGILMLLTAFIFPVFSIFTASSVTALAIFGIGTSILVDSLKNVDWDDKIVAFATIFAIVFNILTNSVSDGIGFGLIFYVIMMLAAKKGKKLSLVTYFIALIFVAYFVIKVLG